MENPIARWSLIGAFLVFCVFFVQDCSVARQNNSKINPEIFKAFDAIERAAFAKYAALVDADKDPELFLTNRELIAARYGLERSRDAAYGDSDESAQEYYYKLSDLDYRLPPLYKDGYIPKHPWWKFWK